MKTLHLYLCTAILALAIVLHAVLPIWIKPTFPAKKVHHAMAFDANSAHLVTADELLGPDPTKSK